VRWNLFVAGAAAAATLYTHLRMAVLLPTYPLYYLAAVTLFRRGPWLREVGRAAGLLAAGAAALTVGLGLVNRSLGGGFWFYLPSLRFGIQTIGAKNPWYVQHVDWLHATWLYLHLFGAGVCLLAVLSWL